MFHTKHIQYGELNPKGSRKIEVILDDENGRLEEERQRYLRILGGLAEKELIKVDEIYVPKIGIGYLLPDYPALTEALDMLGRFVPDTISLSKVYSSPPPDYGKSGRKFNRK